MALPKKTRKAKHKNRKSRRYRRKVGGEVFLLDQTVLYKVNYYKTALPGVKFILKKEIQYNIKYKIIKVNPDNTYNITLVNETSNKTNHTEFVNYLLILNDNIIKDNTELNATESSGNKNNKKGSVFEIPETTINNVKSEDITKIIPPRKIINR